MYWVLGVLVVYLAAGYIFAICAIAIEKHKLDFKDFFRAIPLSFFILPLCAVAMMLL